MFLRTEETAYQDLIAMNDVYTHDVRDTLRSEMARPISDVMRSNTQHWAPGDQGQCRGQLLRSGVGHYASSPGSPGSVAPPRLLTLHNFVNTFPRVTAATRHKPHKTA